MKKIKLVSEGNFVW